MMCVHRQLSAVCVYVCVCVCCAGFGSTLSGVSPLAPPGSGSVYSPYFSLLSAPTLLDTEVLSAPPSDSSTNAAALAASQAAMYHSLYELQRGTLYILHYIQFCVAICISVQLKYAVFFYICSVTIMFFLFTYTYKYSYVFPTAQYYAACSVYF